MFPILSDLTAILARQKRKGGGYEPGSGAKWDWGWRVHPVTGDRKWHNGLDLPAPKGTPIYAPIPGRISAAHEDSVSGKYIKIAHDDASYPDIIETVYCHLSAFGSGIRLGVRVTAGQLIGYVGSTGRSTGPHLHFIIRTKQGEEYDGHHRDTDPLPYIEGKKNFAAAGGLLAGLGLAGALYWWYTKH